MNSYDLSRNFWNWAFENPEKVSPNHAAIYFFAIEHCNRLGWKEKFGFPSLMTMDAIGIKKHQTYIKYFNDLIDYKFFKLIQKSRNQYSANIISLIGALPKKDKALDKAIIKHAAKQTQPNGQSTGQSKVHIDKQVNQQTNKPINQETMIFLFEDELFKKSFIEYENFICHVRKLDYGVSDIELSSMQRLLNSWSGGDIKKAIEIIDVNISGGYKKLYSVDIKEKKQVKTESELWTK